jgi:CRISPR-associated protein Cas5d
MMADDPSIRQQRQTMAIRNPRFRLTARIVPRRGREQQQPAFDDQFVRRATRGKCWMQPCFGCREFVAFFRLVDQAGSEAQPVNYSQDLGYMLYDVFDLRRVNDSHAKPFITMFRARIERGVLNVPPFDSDEVLKPEPTSTNARGIH